MVWDRASSVRRRLNAIARVPVLVFARFDEHDRSMAESEDAAQRARQRDLVRHGYDTISLAYRSDDGTAATCSAEDVRR